MHRSNMDPIEVEPHEVKKKEVDDYGRFGLGKEYAGKTVKIAILEVEDGEE